MHLGQNVTNFTENLRLVRERISHAAERYQRDPATISLVAVTKRHPAATIEAAFEAGQRDFGENFVQEALEKMDHLKIQGLRWHFIGKLQSNKTRAVAEHFDWIHTVERVKIASRLSEQRPHYAPPLKVCIQVDVGRAERDSGAAPGSVGELADAIVTLPKLDLRGLMCMPPIETDFERQRAHFRTLRLCLEELNRRGHQLSTLSMGMSGDMEAAIAEGSTMLRIGTALFGPRPE